MWFHEMTTIDVVPMSSMVLLMLLVMTTISSSIITAQADQKISCNPYVGKWVYDESYPLFDASKCRLFRKLYDCQNNGRPDRGYLKYRWQPDGCNLQRFNGVNFLRSFKGKKMLLVGDSLSENQYASLLCLLTTDVGNSSVVSSRINNTSTLTFQEYNVSISYSISHYLVDIETREIGRVLNLDSIKDGETWKAYDVLIFNTWHWWYRGGSKQPWDYIENNGNITKNMDRMEAFRKALTTWAKWVNSPALEPTTKVFFQGISPSQYRGEEWGEPGVNSCANETKPLLGSTYPGGDPLSLKVLKEVLDSTQLSPRDRVHLLDITTLSQLRKDGHPSRYNRFGRDCTHWCIAGVVDTWNQLLYAHLLPESIQIEDNQECSEQISV